MEEGFLGGFVEAVRGAGEGSFHFVEDDPFEEEGGGGITLFLEVEAYSLLQKAEAVEFWVKESVEIDVEQIVEIFFGLGSGRKACVVGSRESIEVGVEAAAHHGEEGVFDRVLFGAG